MIQSPINYLDFKGIRITCLVSVGIFDSINTILFDWFHPDFKSRMSFDSEFSPYFNGRNTFEIHRYCFNLNFFREHKKTPWVRFTPTHGVQFKLLIVCQFFKSALLGFYTNPCLAFNRLVSHALLAQLIGKFNLFVCVGFGASLVKIGVIFLGI